MNLKTMYELSKVSKEIYIVSHLHKMYEDPEHGDIKYKKIAIININNLTEFELINSEIIMGDDDIKTSLFAGTEYIAIDVPFVFTKQTVSRYLTELLYNKRKSKIPDILDSLEIVSDGNIFKFDNDDRISIIERDNCYCDYNRLNHAIKRAFKKRKIDPDIEIDTIKTTAHFNPTGVNIRIITC